jgi:hypothetical protein
MYLSHTSYILHMYFLHTSCILLMDNMHTNKLHAKNFHLRVRIQLIIVANCIHLYFVFKYPYLRWVYTSCTFDKKCFFKQAFLSPWASTINLFTFVIQTIVAVTSWQLHTHLMHVGYSGLCRSTSTRSRYVHLQRSE